MLSVFRNFANSLVGITHTKGIPQSRQDQSFMERANGQIQQYFKTKDWEKLLWLLFTVFCLLFYTPQEIKLCAAMSVLLQNAV